MRSSWIALASVVLAACSTTTTDQGPRPARPNELAGLPFESAANVRGLFKTGTEVVQHADNGAVRRWSNGNGTFHASTGKPNFEGGEGYFSVSGPGTWMLRDNQICVAIQWQVKQAQVGNEAWCQGLIKANGVLYLVPLDRQVPRSGAFNAIYLRNPAG